MCILTELANEFGSFDVIVSKPNLQGTIVVKVWGRFGNKFSCFCALSGPINANTTVDEALSEIRDEIRKNHSANQKKVSIQ